MKSNLRKQFLIGLAVTVWATVFALPVSADGFIRGIVINVDGEEYYLAGAPDAPNNAIDIPGHSWVQAGPNKIVGKHYNTGPFGEPSWWSSDAGDGEFLFKVDGIIDTWTLKKAKRYEARGYVHRHELVSVEDGSPHPNKVVWLRHIARTSFTLDRGPHPHPPEPGIEITPGVALNFLPNWEQPYPPVP